jgi:hypothetical protein
MRKKWMSISIIIGSLVVVGAVLWGPMASNVENPQYTVLSSEKEIEVRQYKPMIVAEVTTQGTRKEAIGDGFRLLADYIFGNNTAQNKIAMTAPVTQQQNEKISMTAPVTQQETEQGWSVHFVMPSEYTIDTLPKPNNKLVTLKEISAKKFIVIRFSGTGSESNVSKHEIMLNDYLSQNKIEPISSASYAFYNPPLTLPFLRRNEIMVEVKN